MDSYGNQCCGYRGEGLGILLNNQGTRKSHFWEIDDGRELNTKFKRWQFLCMYSLCGPTASEIKVGVTISTKNGEGGISSFDLKYKNR